MTSISVAIAGASGYVGGELLRTLLSHPDVRLGALTAASSAGSTVGEHHPHLTPLADRVLDPTDADHLAGHDVVFLALPHGASAEVAAALGDDVLVVDCGADFRLESGDDWTTFYGGEHAGTWPYGLPELPGQRERLCGATRIAVPGCFPTVSTLTIMPAVLDRLVGDDVNVVAPTGTSGAGKSLKPSFLASEVLGQASAYGVGGVHRHTPEIEQNLRACGAQDPRVSFTPVLAPMARGILAVVSAPVVDGVTDADIRAAYEKTYADEPFVRVLPDGRWPQTQAVLGATMVHLQATLDQRAGRLVAIGAMDNLAKGTAGGAVQSMNLALGLPETTGLSTIGVAP
ncbi:N-acetyl-gamma-glutamyl-phosphate reductase [Mumia zhuanghuii]|uniref:N-acetyl-gamma-glutamyl-phosphate reductase n=1 Tax=Mumia zhuanghuii TaxID=2585211 RepID=A0A5C4MU07_9ACTN|nr:N-acetyl-gamma-glutamyl-phosphate reductase [Mumia zhuanghuii]TNC47944.1 N-acetyl-gamma-glutamyl-phosphate reductase [Mumia zhuanghuii]